MELVSCYHSCLFKIVSAFRQIYHSWRRVRLKWWEMDGQLHCRGGERGVWSPCWWPICSCKEATIVNNSGHGPLSYRAANTQASVIYRLFDCLLSFYHQVFRSNNSKMLLNRNAKITYSSVHYKSYLLCGDKPLWYYLESPGTKICWFIENFCLQNFPRYVEVVTLVWIFSRKISNLLSFVDWGLNLFCIWLVWTAN